MTTTKTPDYYSVGTFTRSGRPLGRNHLTHDEAVDLAEMYASRGLVAEICGWCEGDENEIDAVREVISNEG